MSHLIHGMSAFPEYSTAISAQHSHVAGTHHVFQQHACVALRRICILYTTLQANVLHELGITNTREGCGHGPIGTFITILNSVCLSLGRLHVSQAFQILADAAHRGHQ